MKRKYICPQLLVVRLNTTHSILTVSGMDNGTLNINDNEEVTVDQAWIKENSSVWDNEW